MRAPRYPALAAMSLANSGCFGNDRRIEPLTTMYSALKALHVVCAVLTIAGFVLRSVWRIRGSPLARHSVTRIAPHVIDTLLLASGIALAFELRAGSWLGSWLPAKLLGIVAYIALGFVALRFARTPRARILALASALAAFAYVLGTAVTKSPASWFASTLP